MSLVRQRQEDCLRQRERSAKGKALLAAIKGAAKGSGWRTVQGSLFRELDGWFVEVRAAVWTMEPRTIISLKAKPMAIDPIFWAIMGLEDNRALPLSFRITGAFTCWTPPLVEDDLDDDLETSQAVTAALDWAMQIQTTFNAEQAMQRLAERLDPAINPSSGQQLAAHAGLLIVQGKIDEARRFCRTMRDAGHSGGYTNVDLKGATFFEATLKWLDRPPVIDAWKF